MRSLSEALGYENADVVERFSESYGIPPDESRVIFHETKKMLWLQATLRAEHRLAKRPIPSAINVYRPMQVLDEMWHTFLLFSLPYHYFCRRYLGGYLHHRPTTGTDRRKASRRRREDPQGYRSETRRRIALECRYIADKLGSDTLNTWFKHLPAKYGKALQ